MFYYLLSDKLFIGDFSTREIVFSLPVSSPNSNRLAVELPEIGAKSLLTEKNVINEKQAIGAKSGSERKNYQISMQKRSVPGQVF
ncbi:hypothetical protein D7Y05_10070 [bacterium 1XD42-54]|nr:hypothetical protein D7Y05_10070 [bacterium 1XD42-54]